MAQETSAAAQGSAAPDSKTTRIALGSGSGTPGEGIVIPVYFTPADGVEVGQLKLHVSFVSVNLKFEKLEQGIAAELGNVELKTEVKLDKNEQGLETTTLTVVASPAASEPAKKAIPSGLLGYMTLRISEKGRPANIALRTTAEATQLGTNKKLDKLQAAGAQVEVMAPGSEPLVACFFFTH